MVALLLGSSTMLSEADSQISESYCLDYRVEEPQWKRAWQLRWNLEHVALYDHDAGLTAVYRASDGRLTLLSERSRQFVVFSSAQREAWHVMLSETITSAVSKTGDPEEIRAQLAGLVRSAAIGQYPYLRIHSKAPGTNQNRGKLSCEQVAVEDIAGHRVGHGCVAPLAELPDVSALRIALREWRAMQRKLSDMLGTPVLANPLLIDGADDTLVLDTEITTQAGQRFVLHAALPHSTCEAPAPFATPDDYTEVMRLSDLADPAALESN